MIQKVEVDEVEGINREQGMKELANELGFYFNKGYEESAKSCKDD